MITRLILLAGLLLAGAWFGIIPFGFSFPDAPTHAVSPATAYVARGAEISTSAREWASKQTPESLAALITKTKDDAIQSLKEETDSAGQRPAGVTDETLRDDAQTQEPGIDWYRE